MKDRKMKFRLFSDYEKEEDWVNAMAKKGWHLISFGLGTFTFKKGDPGKYIFRNEMIYEIGKKDDSKDYLEFLEGSGIELVKKKLNWAYFRKEAADGPFELYSDTSSKLAYLNRFFYPFIFVFFINLFIGIINLILFSFASKESITDFVAGVNTGVAIALIYPILKVMKKRKNLKNQLEIFND